MLWLPVSSQFGPEISDVVSAGLSGRIDDNIEWSLGSYYKWTGGMVDFIPGASFIHDSSLVDMIESIRLEAWCIETGLMKTRGKVTGTLSYTYSRSEREWPAPDRRNTYYFKQTYDQQDERYYFKNMSLFPIMPSLAVRVSF